MKDQSVLTKKRFNLVLMNINQIPKTCLFTCLLVMGLWACKSGPKVITSSSSTEKHPAAQGSGIFSEGLMPSSPPVASTTAADVHEVVVEEILPTEKYVYLRVQEGEETYWIATTKQPIDKGGTYYYRDGLLKTNFHSREYDRVFDKVYLVSKLVAHNHGQQMAQQKPGVASGQAASGAKDRGMEREGDVKIAELVKNPQKYEGKTVQISGKCVKVNPNIMNRNWIHIQDGSQDDYDLVVTSTDLVHEGEVVHVRAKVVLNEDFGAGYKYDIILEEGVLLH